MPRKAKEIQHSTNVIFDALLALESEVQAISKELYANEGKYFGYYDSRKNLETLEAAIATARRVCDNATESLGDYQ